MYCNGFVPVAFLVISLTIIRFFMNHKTNKRKETYMEHVNENNKCTTGLKSMIETVWAIGTSVAATGALT
jgi:hypothetical protein